MTLLNSVEKGGDLVSQTKNESDGDVSIDISPPGTTKDLKEPTADPGHAPGPAPNITYPSVPVQSIIVFGLLLAQFLVALDTSIIATAIPTMTIRFHSVDQVGWYGSAFFMCLAVFQAFWGKLYKYYRLRIVFVACVIVFELGSLIVAVAQNSTIVIVGRAIQGSGGAGITGGCYVICAFVIQPFRVPAVMGVFGLVWSCASVLGPILGGVFTQDVSWRWCFYINLPIGAITLAIFIIFFRTPAHSRMSYADLKDLPLLLDLPGMVIVAGSFVCILLALENGGVSQPWSSSAPIGLLIGFGLLVVAFIVVEWKQGEKAMIVGRIVKRRSIWACAAFNFCAQASGYARVYNLPIYFQAAQGVGPTESGIRTLATVLTLSLFGLFSSAFLGKVGYYQVFLLAGGIFTTIGSGLIYTLDVHSPAMHYIGYQVIVGIGMGLTIQVPAIVAQCISPPQDVAVTVSVALFFQYVGGALGVSTAQSIMNNRLLDHLPTDHLGITPAKVVASGAANLRQFFPLREDLDGVVKAYMVGLKDAWLFSLAAAGMSLLLVFAAEWKSIKPEAVKARTTAKAASQTQAA